MRRYALFAVEADNRVRVFATTRPVETGEAGPVLFAALTRDGLRGAAVAAGVTTDRPGVHAAVLREGGMLRSIALVDSAEEQSIRALAENVGAEVVVVAIEPLLVPLRAPRSAGAVPIAFCLACEDFPARSDGSCAACERLAAFRRRGTTGS